jgi:PKD repeat protein
MKIKFLLVVFLVVLISSCKEDSQEVAGPKALFVAVRTDVNITDTVRFINESENIDISSIQWLFDGGFPGTSTEPSPFVIYYAPGDYPVKLVVKNKYGTDSLLKTNYIHVSSTLDSGLIAHYPLNGNAIDLSGNNLNGSVIGADPFNDRNGNPGSACFFDGVSDYIELPIVKIKGLNTYSYSIWLKPQDTPKNYAYYAFSIGEKEGAKCQTVAYQTTSTFFAGSYNIGMNPQQSYSKSDLREYGNWNHLVVIRDETYIRLYINGQLIEINNNSATNHQSAFYGEPTRAIIGGRSDLQYDCFFKGAIDDFRYYDRVLTEKEINELHRLR